MKLHHVIGVITGFIAGTLLFQAFSLESACTPLLKVLQGCPDPAPWFVSAAISGILGTLLTLLASGGIPYQKP